MRVRAWERAASGGCGEGKSEVAVTAYEYSPSLVETSVRKSARICDSRFCFSS